MVEINRELCTGCGLCVSDCFPGNIRINDGAAEALGSCMLCGHCVAVCPVNAVSIPDYPAPEDKGIAPRIPYETVIHNIQFRRSIRQFERRPVERDVLEKLLEAGRYSETGKNAQQVSYIVVQEKLDEIKPLIWDGMLKSALNDPGRNLYSKAQDYMRDSSLDGLFFDAPVLLVILANGKVNGTIAATNIEAAAVSLGLGCLFSGYIEHGLTDSPDALKALGIEAKDISNCMLIGYPSVSYQRIPPRKPADVTWM